MNRNAHRFLSAAVGFLALASQSSAALIGYWTFDSDTPPTTGTTSTVLDQSGKGYNGTLNTVTVTPDTRYSTDVPVELAGIAGAKSLTLAGGNHYVQIGAVGTAASNADFNFTGGPFTISFWYKGWPQTLDYPIISKNGTTTSAQGWQIKRSSVAANVNNLMFSTQGLSNVDFEPPDSPAVNSSLASGVTPTGPARWTHVVMTYDNTVKTVYMNGMQSRSVSPTANGKIAASTEPLVFGARSVAGVLSSFSSVQLDDVAIFNHALTAAEVFSLAKGADPRTVPGAGRSALLNRMYPWGVGEPWGTPGNFGVRALRDAEGPNAVGGTTFNNMGDLSYVLRNKSNITRFNNDAWLDGSYSKISFRDPDNSGGTGIYAGPTAAVTTPPTATSYYNFVPWNITGNEDYAMFTATGCIRIPAGVAAADNKWTFFHGGDDGTQLVIYNATWSSRSNASSLISGEVSVHGTTGGNSNVFSTVVLPPGDYNVRYDYYERTGGAWFELWAAPGTLTTITQIAPPRGADPWRLVGDTAQGGLALVDHVPLVELSCDTNVIIGTPPSQIKLTYDQRFCDSPSIMQTRASDGTTTLQNLTAGHGDVTISPAPTETTTYTLAGVHAGNNATKTVTVYVNQAPVITNFTVADNTLAPNFGSTFTIGTIGGTSWSINNGVGSATLTTTAGINSGTKTFTVPNGTAPGVYTYTLTATNSVGSTTASLTITVAPPPVIAAFTATAGATGTEPGTIYTLHYDVTDADTAVISPRLGNLAPSATRTFLGDTCDYPGSSTTYTITATNIYGTSTATATATINALLGLDANGWTVTMYKAATAGTMVNLANTDALVAGTAARGTVVVGGVTTATPITKTNIPRINFANNTASGVFSGDTWPTEFGPTTTTDMAAVCTATIIVNYEDDYTININNDDGARLQIDLNNDGDFLDPGEEVIVDDAGHGPTTTSNDRHLTTGPHAIKYTFFQGTGGFAMEVFFTTAQGTNVLFEPLASPAPAIVTSGLIISEFQASNSGTLADYDGQNSDWIELYNGTATAINLSGYALTDDAALPAKYKFATSGAPTIQPGQYLVVFASGKNTIYPTGEIHTNFKLASSFTLPATTGYVALTKDDGTATNTYVTVSSYTYPEQKKDRSYGVSGAALNLGVIAVPTPGGRNFASYLGFVGDTHFDHDRGNNYTAPFDLTITTSDPAAQIRYTTDGSEPTIYKGNIYTAPLHIDKTSVIRAAGFRKNYAPTNIDTQTYIFVPDVVTQNRAQAIAQGWPNEPNGVASATLNSQIFDYGMDPLITTGNEAAIQTALKAIPSLSLVVDPSSLFDKTSGIFVNPSQRGKAWERVASLELINDVYADPTLATKDPALGGNGQFQIASGVRIRGGASRSANNPKREWHMYFRSELDGSLSYPLFGAGGASKFDQFDIKTANNYAWSYAPTNTQLTYTPSGGSSTVKRINMNTMMRDVFARDTQRDMGQPYGHGRYYHLYVNGVYWGLHEIEERTEASFGETYLGGDKNNYDVVKSAGNANGYNTEATDGTMLQGTSANPGSAWARLWWRARELRLTAGLTEAQKDERLLDLMGLKPDGTPWNDPVNHPVLLDVDNLADYLLTSFYCGSYDAPMSTFVLTGSNNWFGARDRNGNEGFKFFAHDFEHGFGTDWNNGATAPTVTRGSGTTGGSVAVPVGIQIGTSVTGNTGTPVTYASTAWQLHSTDARSFDRTGPWGAGDGVTGASDTAANTNAKQERNWKGQLMYELSVTYLKSNPQLIHEDLCFSREYRRLFADRAYKHLGRTGGALTQTEVNKRLDSRATTVGSAIIGESARWGDAKGQALADYQVSSWTNAKNFLYDWVARGSNQAYTAWLNNPATTGIGRSGEIIKQLQNYRDKANASGVTFDTATPPNPNDPTLLSLPLYPTIGTPTFDLAAGIYPVNTTLTISNNNTTGATTYTIYYTTNGTDPRTLLTGLPSGSAINAGTGATATVNLTTTGTVQARVYDGTNWSGLFDTSYIIGAPATHANLVITEINYNPAGSVSPGGAANPGTAVDPQLYEFIELRNISGATLQLTGVKFSLAMDYTFPDGSTLVPGGRLVVVRDPVSFVSRYPAVPVWQIYGPWLGALNNGGERITLTDASAAVIQSVYYNNTPAAEVWPNPPKGDGPTLVFLTPNAPAASAANSPPAEWTSHIVNLGNPGGPDFGYLAFQMANSASSNGQGDNDKDGISDLIEYVLGTNPTNPDGAASSTEKLPTSALMNLVVGANPAEPYQTLTYTRAPNTADVTVAAQTSSDLGNNDAWTVDAVLVSSTVNGDGSTTYIYRCPQPYSTDNREFMRLLVTLPAP